MSYYIFTQATGVITVDTATLRADVEAEWTAAFGNDLALTPDTPQGVMITAETLAREGVLRNTAQLANQINPNVAEGVFLDAVWALTGGKRRAATKTVVPGVVLSGVPSSIIPAGAVAANSATGARFILANVAILDNSGQAVGVFVSVADGEVPCAAGDLSQIVTGVLGWESVTNPAAGVLGTAVESDEQSRVRRKQTLALQGVSINEATVSRLMDTEGVSSVSFRENYTAAPVVIEGIPLVANSIWACVDGGTDDAVAAALLETKSAGCDWNGGVAVNVVDQYSGQTYPVLFDRPTPRAILVNVTIRAGAISDPVNAVKQAVLDYAAGLLLNEPGFTIGTDVSAFELAVAINAQLPGVFVQLVEVAFSSGSPVWLSLLTIATNEKATVDASAIAVTVS
jgi:hypothetical protein